MKNLVPVILCGGSGTRLWPLSRFLYPKQFMDINGSTLLTDTLLRIKPIITNDPPIIVCNEEHRFYVASTLQQAGMKGNILLEPKGRNTAPAVALAALQARARNQDAVILVLPSDHFIQPIEDFVKAIDKAYMTAADGYIVTFGIIPDNPATGYGYIQKGFPINNNAQNCYEIVKFIEKPDAAAARDFVKQDSYFWNSGMFMMQADVYLNELTKFAPEIYTQVEKAWANRTDSQDFIRPDAKSFIACPSDSIDYAVMEYTQKGAVMPLGLQWSDMGSWDAFYQMMPKNDDNNVCFGDVLCESSRSCYLHSSGRLLVGLGIENLAVIETADAVLVSSLSKVQQVKNIVDILERDGRAEFELHPLVYRPWGSYERLINKERFQVKRIVINSGEELSLQKHHHRAEHWIVVGGTAEVTLNGKINMLTENQSIYIPLGAAHKLKNPGIIPLIVIEIQTGSYLGEDDIVRLADNYGR